MRLPLASLLESRDGTLDKDANLKNAIMEVVDGEVIVSKRPGLTTLFDEFLTPAQGIFNWEPSVPGDPPQLAVVADDVLNIVPFGGTAWGAPVNLAFPPEVSHFVAMSCSYDGSVIVGYMYTIGLPVDYHKPAIWTSDGTIYDLFLDALEAYGVSSDGSIVVGVSAFDGLSRAFKWSGGVVTNLGNFDPVGGVSRASGVSDDGSVVVGRGQALNVSLTYDTRAFRWTAGSGMEDLGTFGGSNSSATGVSADGSIIVGTAEEVGGVLKAFRWTSATGKVSLGTLGGATSSAAAISPDGTMIVGTSLTAAGKTHAYIWTEATGMVDIGAPEDLYSYTSAFDVSDTGAIVGWTRLDSGKYNPYVWTAEQGFTILQGREGNGSSTGAAQAISGDGTVAVGFCWEPEPQTGCQWKLGPALPYALPL